MVLPLKLFRLGAIRLLRGVHKPFITPPFIINCRQFLVDGTWWKTKIDQILIFGFPQKSYVILYKSCSEFKKIESFMKQNYIFIRWGHTSSGIWKAKQKLGVTFNSDKLGGIDFTKFSKLSMCSAGAGRCWLVQWSGLPHRHCTWSVLKFL